MVKTVVTGRLRIINVLGGLSEDPLSGISRGGDGYVYLMAEIVSGSGSILGGDVFIDPVGISYPGNIFFTGGTGGGGGGAPGAVPEPATLALLGVALAGLGLSRRRKLH